MPTIRAEKARCGWCGKPNATMLCQCHRASFCSKECQVKAFKDSHKFICSAGKDKPNKLKEGDIVEIISDGSQWNGVLAEVYGPDPENSEQLVVLFSNPYKPWEIEQVSIEKTNLILKLGIHESVRQAKTSRKENREALSQACQQPKMAMRELVHRMAPYKHKEEQIVEQIKSGNAKMALDLAFWFPHPLSNLDMSVLIHHGLIDACLIHFPYPSSIDSAHPSGSESSQHFVYLLLKVLHWESQSGQPEAVVFEELPPKLGSLILVSCTKKNRLFCLTEQWIAIHDTFISIMYYLEKNKFAFAKLFDLPGAVVSALLNHLVLLLTMNPTEMLKMTSPGLKEDGIFENFNEGGAKTFQERTVSFYNLYHFPYDPYLEAPDLGKVVAIGMTKMPAGSDFGMAGEVFASCVLDVFAIHGCLLAESVDANNQLDCQLLDCASACEFMNDQLQFLRLLLRAHSISSDLSDAMKDINTSDYCSICNVDEYFAWCKGHCERKKRLHS